MKVKMAKAPIAGLSIGNTIWKNERISPQPSIFAASRSSFGIVCENCFIKKTPNGQPIAGMISPLYVSTQPKSASIVNSGTKITCLGSAIAAISAIKISLRPGNTFLASTKPAVALTKQTAIISALAMKKLLNVQRQTGLLNNVTQLSSIGFNGNHSGGIVIATTWDLNAPVTIQ